MPQAAAIEMVNYGEPDTCQKKQFTQNLKHTRVVNESPDWLASLNHRYLKTSLKDAASQGKRSNIHGFNPVTAYAYGAEFGKGKSEGRY